MTSTTAPRGAQGRSRSRLIISVTAIVLVALVLGFFAFSQLFTDWLWFDQLGYANVLTTGWWGSIAMFGVGLLGMGVPVLVSIELAFRARPVYAKLNAQLDRYQQVLEPLRRLAMWGVPALLGVFTGISTSGRWTTVAQYFNRTSFGTKDAQFGLDVSFYVFEMPLYRGLVSYGSAIVLVAGVAAIATNYLYGGIRVSGRELRISKPARIQLAVTAGVYLLIQAVSLWLDRYDTLTDPNGISSRVTGATYTDVTAVIPAHAILAGIAVLVAVLCFVTAAIGRWRLPLVGTALLLVSALLVGTIYPTIVQRIQVPGSEKSLESTYIKRNIAATRTAYGVSDVDVVKYNATTDATAGALREDAETTANIRVIDPNLVSPTFSQLQQIQQYYKFNDDLDVDRYTIDGTKQDTVIAVRELNQSGQSQSGWVNNVLVYTHGYGVVAAYGNERSDDGTPKFLESGIPTSGALGDYQARVYFGENSPSYSIVDTKTKEVDGSDSTTTYSGNGGPKLDNLVTQLAYAVKFGSEQIVLSNQITSKSQILYDRDPIDRVKQVAPYLETDKDSYPAVVDGRLVWIVDGYTTTSQYPYSEVTKYSQAIADSTDSSSDFTFDDVNYIRNSVKATVDAYTGKVTLYAWDTSDPILKTWMKIYPGTVKSAKTMSTQLLAHVRYPEDLFKVQRSILASYHVTDPNTFYSGNQKWTVPADPTGDGTTTQAPYYLTMQVPGTTGSAFTLYSTYIPQESTDASRSVLGGYLTADSDAGPNYGKLTLLELPSDGSVPGPGAVQNSFNTNTNVTTQVKNLEIGTSTTVQKGNLLTVPVGGGLLYVQPVYVESTGETKYPLLRKILVAFGSNVAIADTLNDALDQLFSGDSGTTTPDSGAGSGGTSSGSGGSSSGGSSSGTGSGSTGSGTVDDTALKAALKDYQTALAAREKAYQDGDLVAAAQADEQMQAAIEAAMKAAGD